MNTALDQLKQHPALGSSAAIARACGLSREAVRKWTRVPAEHCRALEAATGGEITRAQMRPDIFGDGEGKGRAA